LHVLDTFPLNGADVPALWKTKQPFEKERIRVYRRGIRYVQQAVSVGTAADGAAIRGYLMGGNFDPAT